MLSEELSTDMVGVLRLFISHLLTIEQDRITQVSLQLLSPKYALICV